MKMIFGKHYNKVRKKILNLNVGSTEIFEGKNGWGIVYHRSDCSFPNVRSQGVGGQFEGSADEEWLLDNLVMVVYNKGFTGGAPGDHNWTHDEIINNL